MVDRHTIYYTCIQTSHIDMLIDRQTGREGEKRHTSTYTHIIQTDRQEHTHIQASKFFSSSFAIIVECSDVVALKIL